MKKLRGAVIGAGRMGRHHIRIMAQHESVNLVGVVDSDLEQARTISEPWGAPVFANVDELPPIDVAIIVTPTNTHEIIALKLMEKGVHLLIEKPLAHTPKAAARLVEKAAEKHLVLAVGHVERFNPAVRTLKKLCHNPKFVSIDRLSPYTPRISDSVVYDLTIHDIDLACWIVGSAPIQVQAVGTKVFSDTTDAASTIISFANGAVAAIQTSRVTQDKVRRISVSEPERFLVANTLQQNIEIRRQADVSYEGEGDMLTFKQASIIETPMIERGGEPLQVEQDDFYTAVLQGTKPMVTGEEGLRAVELVELIEQRIAENS